MAITRHIHEIYVAASPDRIWEAITAPEYTQRTFLDAAIEGRLETGGAVRFVGSAGDAAVGEIEAWEPPHRLVLRLRFVYDAALADEPPSRVEWQITPAGDATRVTVLHGDLAASPATWAAFRRGWVRILGGLKTLLETGQPLGNVHEDDDPEIDDVEPGWHRRQGVDANNGTWEWLGKPDGERTPEDEELMTRSAYTAAFHWARAADAGPENAARADWLLSRVWVVRRQGALALAHADRCLTVCTEHGLVDFDLAYAHEARARALACLGRDDEARVELARAAAVPVGDDEDREIVEADLAKGPWFGLSV